MPILDPNLDTQKESMVENLLAGAAKGAVGIFGDIPRLFGYSATADAYQKWLDTHLPTDPNSYMAKVGSFVGQVAPLALGPITEMAEAPLMVTKGIELGTTALYTASAAAQGVHEAQIERAQGKDVSMFKESALSIGYAGTMFLAQHLGMNFLFDSLRGEDAVLVRDFGAALAGKSVNKASTIAGKIIENTAANAGIGAFSYANMEAVNHAIRGMILDKQLDILKDYGHNLLTGAALGGTLHGVGILAGYKHAVTGYEEGSPTIAHINSDGDLEYTRADVTKPNEVMAMQASHSDTYHDYLADEGETEKSIGRPLRDGEHVVFYNKDSGVMYENVRDAGDVSGTKVSRKVLDTNTELDLSSDEAKTDWGLTTNKVDGDHITISNIMADGTAGELLAHGYMSIKGVDSEGNTIHKLLGEETSNPAITDAPIGRLIVNTETMSEEERTRLKKLVGDTRAADEDGVPLQLKKTGHLEYSPIDESEDLAKIPSTAFLRMQNPEDMQTKNATISMPEIIKQYIDSHPDEKAQLDVILSSNNPEAMKDLFLAHLAEHGKDGIIVHQIIEKENTLESKPIKFYTTDESQQYIAKGTGDHARYEGLFPADNSITRVMLESDISNMDKEQVRNLLKSNVPENDYHWYDIDRAIDTVPEDPNISISDYINWWVDNLSQHVYGKRIATNDIKDSSTHLLLFTTPDSAHHQVHMSYEMEPNGAMRIVSIDTPEGLSRHHHNLATRMALTAAAQRGAAYARFKIDFENPLSMMELRRLADEQGAALHLSYDDKTGDLLFDVKWLSPRSRKLALEPEHTYLYASYTPKKNKLSTADKNALLQAMKKLGWVKDIIDESDTQLVKPNTGEKVAAYFDATNKTIHLGKGWDARIAGHELFHAVMDVLGTRGEGEGAQIMKQFLNVVAQNNGLHVDTDMGEVAEIAASVLGDYFASRVLPKKELAQIDDIMQEALDKVQKFHPRGKGMQQALQALATKILSGRGSVRERSTEIKTSDVLRQVYGPQIERLNEELEAMRIPVRIGSDGKIQFLLPQTRDINRMVHEAIKTTRDRVAARNAALARSKQPNVQDDLNSLQNIETNILDVLQNNNKIMALLHKANTGPTTLTFNEAATVREVVDVAVKAMLKRTVTVRSREEYNKNLDMIQAVLHVLPTSPTISSLVGQELAAYRHSVSLEQMAALTSWLYYNAPSNIIPAPLTEEEKQNMQNVIEAIDSELEKMNQQEKLEARRQKRKKSKKSKEKEEKLRQRKSDIESMIAAGEVAKGSRMWSMPNRKQLKKELQSYRQQMLDKIAAANAPKPGHKVAGVEMVRPEQTLPEPVTELEQLMANRRHPAAPILVAQHIVQLIHAGDIQGAYREAVASYKKPRTADVVMAWIYASYLSGLGTNIKNAVSNALWGRFQGIHRVIEGGVETALRKTTSYIPSLDKFYTSRMRKYADPDLPAGMKPPQEIFANQGMKLMFGGNRKVALAVMKYLLHNGTVIGMTAEHLPKPTLRDKILFENFIPMVKDKFSMEVGSNAILAIERAFPSHPGITRFITYGSRIMRAMDVYAKVMAYQRSLDALLPVYLKNNGLPADETTARLLLDGDGDKMVKLMANEVVKAIKKYGTVKGQEAAMDASKRFTETQAKQMRAEINKQLKIASRIGGIPKEMERRMREEIRTARKRVKDEARQKAKAPYLEEAKKAKKSAPAIIQERIQHAVIKASNDSADFAAYATFMDRPGKITENFMKLRDSVPFKLGHAFVPFILTISNIVKRGVEMTPGVGAGYYVGKGLSYKTEREAKIQRRAALDQTHRYKLSEVRGQSHVYWARDQRFTDMVAKQLEGAVVMASMLALFNRDKITGNIPTDPKKRAMFYAAGKLPYSFKVGGNWVQYKNIEPIGSLFAMVGAIQKAIEDAANPMDATKAFSDGANAIAKYILSSTWVQPALNLQTAWGFKSSVTNIVGGLVPYGSLFGEFNRAWNAMGKEGRTVLKYQPTWADDFLKTFNRVVPFANLGDHVPKRDVWGKPVVIPGGMMRQFLPYKWRAAISDPVENELARLNVYPAYPQTKMKLGKLELPIPVHLYEEYSIHYGSDLKDRIGRLMQSGRYQNLTDDNKKIALIGRVARQVRTRNQRHLRAEFRRYLISQGYPVKEMRDTTSAQKSSWPSAFQKGSSPF